MNKYSCITFFPFCDFSNFFHCTKKKCDLDSMPATITATGLLCVSKLVAIVEHSHAKLFKSNNKHRMNEAFKKTANEKHK